MTRGRCRLVAAAAALALLIGCSAWAARPQPAGRGADGADAARRFQSPRGYHETPVPVGIAIPRIQVASRLIRLGRDRHGTVQTPTMSQADLAGWYAPGPRPGDPGPAVILGHVDSQHAPAVFFRLRELRRGDRIDVTRADGSTVHFLVERTEQHAKVRFPTDDVYYPTLTPTLRLVTCGGEFDPNAGGPGPGQGHYLSNIIVFATIKR